MFKYMRVNFNNGEPGGDGGGGVVTDPPATKEEPKELDIVTDEEGVTKILLKQEDVGSKEKPGSDDKEHPGEEKPEFSAEFTEKIKGKSPEELAKLLWEKESFTGVQSTEIGQLRNVIDKALAVTTSKDIEGKISKIDGKISKLDEKLEDLDETDDAADWGKLSKQKDDLEKEKTGLAKEQTQLEISETVKEIYAKEHNEDLCEKIRAGYKKDMGLDFKDDQWEVIVKIASKLAPGPKLTEEDMESALMRALTVPVYNKIKSAQTKANVREELTKAGKLETKELGGGSAHAASGLVAADFLSLPKEQQAAILERLPYEKKKDLYKLLDED